MTLLAGLHLHLELTARFLDVRYQRVGFVLLGAFLCSFLFIRTSARLIRSPKVPWWPGSVTTGSGLHLHHLVWGIVLMMTVGFVAFITPRSSPLNEILAALFGIGMGLTMDEFALWIHLSDVYWAREGRESLDAVVVVTLLGGLIVLGVAPFDLPHNASSLSTMAVSLVLDVGLATITILKGRKLLGLVGIFIPLVSVIALVRLATPGSFWARRFYRAGGAKLARSQARFALLHSREERLADVIAGAPDVAGD